MKWWPPFVLLSSVEYWDLSQVWNTYSIVTLWRLGTCWCVLGGFGYHGNLLVDFGFWFLVRRVSNFLRRYSRSGLECPETSAPPMAYEATRGRIWWNCKPSYPLSVFFLQEIIRICQQRQYKCASKFLCRYLPYNLGTYIQCPSCPKASSLTLRKIWHPPSLTHIPPSSHSHPPSSLLPYFKTIW